MPVYECGVTDAVRNTAGCGISNFLVGERRPFAAKHLRQFSFPTGPERDRLRLLIGLNRENDVILHFFSDLRPLNRRMNGLNKLFNPLA